MTVLDNEALRAKLMEQFHIDDYFESLTNLKIDLVNFAKDEIILKEGENVEYLYFILVGRVKSFSYSMKADFDVIHMNKGLLGDVEFVTAKPAIRTIQVVSDTLCMRLYVKGYRHRLMSDRNFLRYLTTQLADKIVVANDPDAGNLEQLSSEDRLFEYLKLSVREDGLITQSLREISPIMGVSYRHLIRMMNALCEDGRLKHGDVKGKYYMA